MKSKLFFMPALAAYLSFLSANPASSEIVGEWASGFQYPGGNGMDDIVQTLVAGDIGSGPALYAGGRFTNAGGTSANRIAKWNGSTWSSLGSGMNGIVWALTIFDDGGGPALYAGGQFTNAGGVSANGIAKWNGTDWSPLSSGVNQPIHSLAVFDDGGGQALYVGGGFTTAGGVGANYIAKWDGATWSALGSGMGHAVFGLSVFDDGGGSALYAGGQFTNAGGVSANRIAKWNGNTWSPLGSGLGHSVLALTVFNDGGGSALYAGGVFLSAGGVSANHIAKWNGANWSALGSGTDSEVDALTVFDDGGGPALYAGGYFFTAGGVSANSLAKWDGANWSALGSGMPFWVYALTGFDDGGGPALYAGGTFTTAGGMPSTRIAKWRGKPCGNDNQCIDQLFCNGVETCDLDLGFCITGTPPCPAPICDEDMDTCNPCTVQADCPDDGLYCNGVESCDLISGLCTHGGISCPPNQMCDEETNMCLDLGACCLDAGTVCFEGFEPDCVNPPPNGAGGVFVGPDSHCPEQNAALIQEGDGVVFVHVIGPPVDCVPGPGPVVLCTPGQPLKDPWKSPESGSMCHNFGVGPESPAIPAGFFGANSEPYVGAVCLKGSSLGDPLFGDADTIIQRTADPFVRCAAPSGTQSTVSIEIVALSLISTSPITVTYTGGQPDEQWDAAVDLSPTVTPPQGSLTATKSHCNGGTYTSTLNVQPRFTFTKVGRPSEVRVLDTGAVMPPIPYVTLDQTTPAPWVGDVDPDLFLMGDPCSAFHAGVEQMNPVINCDCNGNGMRDDCDIDGATSLDCQPDGVPDECQLGANDVLPPGGDGIPDQCNCVSSIQCPLVDDDNVCACNKCTGTALCGLGPIEYGDVNCSGGMAPVDLDDILCTVVGFGGFANCPNADIHPSCDGNDAIDLDDILGVLAAFGGFDPCACEP